MPKYGWPYSKVSLQTPLTKESILDGLKTSVYGRCAFLCEEDQVDHQFVQMRFKNGVTASLKMCYGAEPGRRLVFYGTDGEIIMDERSDTIAIMPYGKEKEIIRINTLTEDGNSHGGGDGVLIREMYNILSGTTKPTTPLSESVECHLMGIAAEESRKQGGALVPVHQ
jgi:predicted dehydrogenase